MELEAKDHYFALAALVGIAKHVGARRTFPSMPLAAVSEWMRGQDKYQDMADAFHTHHVLSIAVPNLEHLAVSTAIPGTKSIRVRELIADFKAAHPAPGVWMGGSVVTNACIAAPIGAVLLALDDDDTADAGAAGTDAAVHK